MASIPTKIETWQMVEAGKDGQPGKLVRATIDMPELGPGDALVKVAGCGVCHTDLSYFYDGVPTVNQPPLTLGHEISGTVVAGPADLVGKNVIVPAVMPCNKCDICAQGRGNRCLSQKMPGNSLAHFGGFSDYIPVPAEDLCVIDELKMPLPHYAVVADACTTPYQAAMRGQVGPGDRVLITGAAGGVGQYMTQTAKALGADMVVGIDIDEAKLERALKFGADYVINSKGKDFKTIRGEFYEIAKKAGVPKNYGWKIFECTGVTPGQDLALGLLSFIGKMIVVGFSPKPNTFAISRLMAFDAELIGTWGCLPKYYPAVLELVQAGKVQIEPFLETKPMSQIQEIFEDQHHGKFDRRQVLIPDFDK
ncbi:MAG: 6-hydroxycyclohex-1-ene-1-carbonyl-CoA dehydrogenase [Deltaproteobacteria bacterium]|nr:6-hydroxycyclohex-1-ene-1-carbonyl-CoA dehydrogenase [Deltaproteobacteria bacterium]